MLQLNKDGREYVIYQSALKVSLEEGELPDVRSSYVSHESMLPFHFSFTSNIREAYLFDEEELDEVKTYSHLLGMSYKLLEIK